MGFAEAIRPRFEREGRSRRGDPHRSKWRCRGCRDATGHLRMRQPHQRNGSPVRGSFTVMRGCWLTGDHSIVAINLSILHTLQQDNQIQPAVVSSTMGSSLGSTSSPVFRRRFPISVSFQVATSALAAWSCRGVPAQKSWPRRSIRRKKDRSPPGRQKLSVRLGCGRGPEPRAKSLVYKRPDGNASGRGTIAVATNDILAKNHLARGVESFVAQSFARLTISARCGAPIVV